jgi:hypothetical protein
MAGLGIIAGIPKEHDYDKYPADDRDEFEKYPITGLAGVMEAADLSGKKRYEQRKLAKSV